MTHDLFLAHVATEGCNTLPGSAAMGVEIVDPKWAMERQAKERKGLGYEDSGEDSGMQIDAPR
jgi:hypothetical protein